MVYADLISFSHSQKTFIRANNLYTKPDIILLFLAGCRITTPGQVILNTQAVKDVGMFDKAYENTSDYELWTKMIIKYEVAKINIPVVLYRKHDAQVSKNQGRMRYFSDKVSLKFWYQLRAENITLLNKKSINNLTGENEKLAFLLGNVAMGAFLYNFAHYDTAIEILEFAQGKHFSPERRDFLNYLSENVPALIKEKFNSDLRITEAEKETLRLQAGIT